MTPLNAKDHNNIALLYEHNKRVHSKLTVLSEDPEEREWEAREIEREREEQQRKNRLASPLKVNPANKKEYSYYDVKAMFLPMHVNVSADTEADGDAWNYISFKIYEKSQELADFYVFENILPRMEMAGMLQDFEAE